MLNLFKLLFMERNIGIPDKIIRISLALVITGLLFKGIIPESLALIVLVPAGIFLLTGLFEYCPLYTAFGIRSR
ncbi:Protein of unknown function [Salinimicrobium catena]|uniref:Inner membrane protein YgaP-like transmembrane domain-containing protein n=2 Tax=Salinimicrobium catena TaxID=390640 RepID=A0A1H5M2M6_9FLAO|nr:Protein of unknown function [Salinimicrobium catena]SEE83532.1 Protein of unknown function [Salinimicrobium catena]